MKADSHRYWRGQLPLARLEAAAGLTAELYALKGMALDALRLQRIIRIVER
ncbi:MAG TPA: hypothetical protein VHY79_18625 [Rhizomicrobium sp.]|jgi:hypothetical protein|nr:hypothetical protein [Rhizomicrobium sp.]